MACHQLLFVAHAVINVEEQATSQRWVGTLVGGFLGIFVLLFEEIAARQKQMNVARDIVRVEELLVRIFRTTVITCSTSQWLTLKNLIINYQLNDSILTEMKCAITNPLQQFLRLAILAFQFKLQQRQGTNVISFQQKFIQTLLAFGRFLCRRLFRFCDTFHHLCLSILFRFVSKHRTTTTLPWLYAIN